MAKKALINKAARACARWISAAGICWMRSTWLGAMLSASIRRRAFSRARSWLSIRRAEPDCTTARWNSP